MPEVVVHHSTRNLGFAGGMNLAYSLASPEPGDLIWLVNPDTSTVGGAAVQLARAITTGAADIVCPVITTGSETSDTVWYGGGGVNVGAGESFHVAHRPSFSPHANQVQQTGFVTGAALMTTAKTWESLGGLREDLFLYWEDTDLSLRALEIGLQLAVVANATMWHRVGGSSDRSGKSRTYYYYMARNRLIVCGARSPKLGILLGRGFRSTVRLMARACREPQGSLTKFLAVAHGSFAGLLARSNQSN